MSKVIVINIDGRYLKEAIVAEYEAMLQASLNPKHKFKVIVTCTNGPISFYSDWLDNDAKDKSKEDNMLHALAKAMTNPKSIEAYYNPQPMVVLDVVEGDKLVEKEVPLRPNLEQYLKGARRFV
jgi:hypothetical protein